MLVGGCDPGQCLLPCTGPDPAPDPWDHSPSQPQPTPVPREVLDAGAVPCYPVETDVRKNTTFHMPLFFNSAVTGLI